MFVTRGQNDILINDIISTVEKCISPIHGKMYGKFGHQIIYFFLWAGV